MTIASEITRIKTNIAGAYTALEEKGAALPETQNSENLADAINSVPITSGGGEEEVIPEGYFKVVFVDYDGTVLSEQFVVNGGTATEPDVPEHEGLTFTQWNRDTTNIIEHSLIGASYSIPSGTVTYVVDITEEQLTQNFYFTYKNIDSSASSEAYIKWGDGTTEVLDSHLTGEVGWNSFAISHTYTSAGRYYIQTYYWQTLAGSSKFQGAGGLTKSVPTNSSAGNLLTLYNNDSSNSIIPEKFEELKELYISAENGYWMKDPFYAPNLEAIVFSDKEHYYLSGSTSNIGISLFTTSYVNRNLSLVCNNKITHITLPRTSWLGTYIIRYMDYLESLSYSHKGYYNIEISYCPKIKKLYNMYTDIADNGTYKRVSLTLSYLPNLTKIYNPIKQGTNAGLAHLYSIKELNFNYPVKTASLYLLNKVNAVFNDVFSSEIFGVSNCNSLQDININWAKINLNTGESNTPLLKSEYLTGILDLSANTSVNFGTTITAQSTISSQSGIWSYCGFSEVILPADLKTLNMSFSNMAKLKKIIFPDSLEVINMHSLFSNCYEIEDISFPENTMATAYSVYGCFSRCYKLKSVTIPNNLIVNSRIFDSCPSLEKVWLPSNVDLSKATSSSSYTIFGSASSSNAANYANVKIYTDAESRPDNWGEYWNYLGDSIYAQVVWGATREEYEAA